MIREGVAGLEPYRAAAAIIVTIKDDPRFTSDQLTEMSNELGRYAHELGRLGK
jgi:hypothetical protein